jgi:hypothetical protein
MRLANPPSSFKPPSLWAETSPPLAISMRDALSVTPPPRPEAPVRLAIPLPVPATRIDSSAWISMRPPVPEPRVLASTRPPPSRITLPPSKRASKVMSPPAPPAAPNTIGSAAVETTP